MTRATQAEVALTQFLALLDGEHWEDLVPFLADEIELADELTAIWLRGRDRVAAYLRAQTGIVTDITSTPTDIATRPVGDNDFLVTFNLRQDYLLDREERHERLTGCAMFHVTEDATLLTLFHLGEAAPTASSATTDEPFDEAAHGELPPPELSLGGQIRLRRDAAALSLRGLAVKCGLSASFLSQVERDQVDVSVTSLRRIARALGATVPALIGDATDGEPTIRTGRRTERSRTHLHELGLTIEAFGSLPDGQIEAWITELEPDAPAFEPRRIEGQERFVFVLSGELSIVGEHAVILIPGEGAHISSASPYRLVAAGVEAVRFLSTQSRPRRD